MGIIGAMWTLPRAEQDIKQNAQLVADFGSARPAGGTPSSEMGRIPLRARLLSRSERYRGRCRRRSDDTSDLFSMLAHHWLGKIPRTLRQ